LVKTLRACAVLVLAAALPGGFAVAGASGSSNHQAQSSAATDAGAAPAPEETGRPICVRVGTRSEGWVWPSGRFIHWAKCKGVVPQCHAAGAAHEVEGWYAGATLVAPAHCSESGRKHQ
jgi:hypothetical protein